MIVNCQKLAHNHSIVNLAKSPYLSGLDQFNARKNPDTLRVTYPTKITRKITRFLTPDTIVRLFSDSPVRYRIDDFRNFHTVYVQKYCLVLVAVTMVRKTLLESECSNHQYSVLKQTIVDRLCITNTAIVNPFVACLYSQGNSVQKIFDTVFFLSVLDEHSGKSLAHRTLPHPFHLLFRKGDKHNRLKLQLDKKFTFGPKKSFNELRDHINSHSTIGLPKMSLTWDTCRRRIAFFIEMLGWYITHDESSNNIFDVTQCNSSKSYVYIHNYSTVMFKDICQWYCIMSDYLQKALCIISARSMCSWKSCYSNFDSFMLDSVNKQRDSESNKYRSESPSGEESDDDDQDTVGDDDQDTVGDDDDKDCVDDDEDTVDQCDDNNKIADDNCDGDDVDDCVDTVTKCDDNDSNDGNKCNSSIRTRDDEIQYYNICVGFAAHLKIKMIGNQKWGSQEIQPPVEKKKRITKKIGLSKGNGDTIDASHITIQQKELIGGVHEEAIGHVLCINGKFIGDKMIDDIYEFVNNHGMIHRDQVFANAKHGYLSYASSLDETVFSYSNGRKKIPAVFLPPIIERLMKIVQEEILDVQFEYMKERSECPGNLHRTVFNGVQVQVGPGFGSHSDRSPDTCYPDPDNNHSRDPRFPHVNEMQVVTIGFVFDNNGKLAGNASAGCCEVVWSTKDKNNQWNVLSKIVTGQIFLHLQMHNIQARCEHYVKPKQFRSARNYVRVVLSFRYTLHARYTGGSYIRYTNVLDSTTRKSERRVPFEKVSNLPSGLALGTDLNVSRHPGIKTKFGNACDDFQQIHPSLTRLKRACGTLTTPKDVAHYARCPEVCRLLVESGTSMEIAYKDETVGNVPHYNELGRIGTSSMSSELRNYADIKASSHRVNIASDDFRFLRDLIPEQAYKNSGKEIQSILQGVVGKSFQEIRSYYNSKSESDHEIWVGPSGGSLVKAGSTPLAMNQREDTDAIAKTPSCMKTNATEQRFIDAVKYRAVVVLHAPERWIDDIKSKSRSKNVVNLGLFYFHSMVVKTHEDLRATCDGESFSEYYGGEGTWTFEQNPIYLLRPVFSRDHPMPERYFELIKSMESCNKPVIMDWENDIVSVGIDRSLLKNPTQDIVTCRRVLCKFVTDRLKQMDCTEGGNDEAVECGRITRLYNCSKEEIKNEISRLTAASWHRLLQNNVYDNNKVGYVKELRVGWVHGMYAIPNPIRSYNVTTALLISTLSKQVGNCYPVRKRSTVSTKEKLVDVLMAIIVVTTTGRLAVFQNYGNNFGAQVSVPDTLSKFNNFIEFMRMKSSDEGRMCDYIGVLYSRSLMNKCTGTVKEYITFLKDCREKLIALFDEDEFNKWVSSEHSYNYYKREIGDIFESVGSNGTTKNGKPHFISHIVVSHMDEIFINDSDEEMNVELGYNGALGPYLIDCGEEANNIRDRWNVFAKFILNIIETACTEELDVWGLERVNNLVVVKINQRPISLIDVECISCKLVATDERTNGSRLISMTPNLYQVYEWPQRIVLGVLTTILANIGTIATGSFTTNAIFESMVINERYKFLEETVKWTHYVSSCESVESDDNNIPLSLDANKCNSTKEVRVTTAQYSKKRKQQTTVAATANTRTSSRLRDANTSRLQGKANPTTRKFL